MFTLSAGSGGHWLTNGEEEGEEEEEEEKEEGILSSFTMVGVVVTRTLRTRQKKMGAFSCRTRARELLESVLGSRQIRLAGRRTQENEEEEEGREGG